MGIVSDRKMLYERELKSLTEVGSFMLLLMYEINQNISFFVFFQQLQSSISPDEFSLKTSELKGLIQDEERKRLTYRVSLI
jgi:cytochrome c-type biogenesis protein CcmE